MSCSRPGNSRVISEAARHTGQTVAETRQVFHALVKDLRASGALGGTDEVEAEARRLLESAIAVPRSFSRGRFPQTVAAVSELRHRRESAKAQLGTRLGTSASVVNEVTQAHQGENWGPATPEVLKDALLMDLLDAGVDPDEADARAGQLLVDAFAGDDSASAGVRSAELVAALHASRLRDARGRRNALQIFVGPQRSTAVLAGFLSDSDPFIAENALMTLERRAHRGTPDLAAEATAVLARYQRKA
jgi:hypothetical protein